MKRITIVLLCLCLLALCVLCLCACNNKSGNYYMFENNVLDKTDFITIKGKAWTNNDGEKGTVSISDNQITFYCEINGGQKKMFGGTLQDGAITLHILGADVIYCKEGVVPHIHNYTKITVPPTCTEEGYTLYKCGSCGDSYTDNERPASHLVQGGCTVGGVCTRCNATVPATQHTPANNWNANETEHWLECLTCGEYLHKATHTLVDNSKFCTVCGLYNAIKVVTGECKYENVWQAGAFYGAKVDVAVRGNIITAVKLYTDAETGWTRTSPSWDHQYGGLGYERAEAAYVDWIYRVFIGKTVAEVNAYKAYARQDGQYVETDSAKLVGATQSSARIICAVQDALSKLGE